MKTLTLATLLLTSLTAQAEVVKTKQTAKDLQANAEKVFAVWKTQRKSSISCALDSGEKIVIKAGENPEDESGLVVEGDFRYGTNEIWQLSTGVDLMLSWGEERNYTAIIENIDGLDGIQVGKTSGKLLLNDDAKLVEMTCELQ